MTGDIPVKSVQIPIFGMGANDPHAVILTCRWKDQGWGNQKGKIFVVAKSSDAREGTKTCQEGRNMEVDETAQFGGGRFVYKSLAPAAHVFEDLQIVFTPRKDEVYHLWIVVGGGGGHLLIVENLCVHTLVFDDSDRTMRKAYAGLHRLGVLNSEIDDSPSINGGDFFQTRLLLAAIEDLQERNAVARGGVKTTLYQFFESRDLATNEESLRSLRELIRILLDFKEQQKRDSPVRLSNGGVNRVEERAFRMFAVM